MRDVGDIYVSGIKRRFYIGCLTAIIGLPCLGGFFWFLLNSQGFEMEGMDALSPTSITIAAVILSILIGVAIPAVLSVFLIKRRADQFDAIFLPLGFTGSMYLLNGRQYHRVDGNTQISIYIFRGPTVEVRVTAPVNAEFRVLQEKSLPAAIGSSLKSHGIRSTEPELDSFVFYPADSGWLPHFIQNQNVARAINLLMSGGAEWAIFRRLELQPGELSLHLNRSREWKSFPISPSEVVTWIRQMTVLSDELQAEGLPKADLTVASDRLKTKQGLNVFVMVVILSILVALPLCVIVAFAISTRMVGNG
ncbi:MAG: hypothetical protein GX577_01690 [Leptolinea sp.]|nr:hypothetical protein [Leptolinea sp.]